MGRLPVIQCMRRLPIIFWSFFYYDRWMLFCEYVLCWIVEGRLFTLLVSISNWSEARRIFLHGFDLFFEHFYLLLVLGPFIPRHLIQLLIISISNIRLGVNSIHLGTYKTFKRTLMCINRNLLWIFIKLIKEYLNHFLHPCCILPPHLDVLFDVYL